MTIVSAVADIFFTWNMVKNREFSIILACSSASYLSQIPYNYTEHKWLRSFTNREFWENLCKTHFFSENLAFSICSLLGSFYAISSCHSLGKIKIQKNPAIKDWIAENKKMVDHFRLIRKILPSSNCCKLVENAHRFVNLRKYLCFGLFMQQRKFFSSTERTFSPEQL